MDKFYVYILKSSTTGKFYVDSTNNLSDRLKRHNSGQNKSTKSGIPWLVVHSEVSNSKQDAYRREFKIKSYKGGEAFRKLVSNK